MTLGSGPSSSSLCPVAHIDWHPRRISGPAGRSRTSHFLHLGTELDPKSGPDSHGPDRFEPAQGPDSVVGRVGASRRVTMRVSVQRPGGWINLACPGPGNHLPIKMDHQEAKFSEPAAGPTHLPGPHLPENSARTNSFPRPDRTGTTRRCVESSGQRSAPRSKRQTTFRNSELPSMENFLGFRTSGAKAAGPKGTPATCWGIPNTVSIKHRRCYQSTSDFNAPSS